MFNYNVSSVVFVFSMLIIYNLSFDRILISDLVIANLFMY